MRFFWHSLQQGARHFFKAQKRHGVHSPLVYQLMDKDLVAPLPAGLKVIQEYRKNLSKSKEKWMPVDYGAGSRSPTRNLGDAVRKATSDAYKGEFLCRWTMRFQPKFILELGTHVGIGSAYLLEGCPEAQLFSIEGDPFLYGKSADWLKRYGQRVHLFNGSFDEQLKEILPIHRWDLVVIDGHHQGDALLKYFGLILPHLSQDAWVIMDDIHWSPDMTEAWCEIVSNANHLLTLDFLHWGAYGHTQRFQKEHFNLKY
jgi:predicted O-methyltransferase YrrM